PLTKCPRRLWLPPGCAGGPRRCRLIPPLNGVCGTLFVPRALSSMCGAVLPAAERNAAWRRAWLFCIHHSAFSISSGGHVFPLAGKDFPESADELAEAIHGALGQVLELPKNNVAVTAEGTFP